MALWRGWQPRVLFHAPSGALAFLRGTMSWLPIAVCCASGGSLLRLGASLCCQHRHLCRLMRCCSCDLLGDLRDQQEAAGRHLRPS